MANKDQKTRGNKEARKPKQAKTKTAATASPFVVTSGKSGMGAKKK